jgi:uncharacterized protein YodC (DUF2158 family)
VTAPSFRRGDRVQCQADGPVMHVVHVEGRRCQCNWVDAAGVLQQGTFEQRDLTDATPTDSAPAPLA